MTFERMSYRGKAIMREEGEVGASNISSPWFRYSSARIRLGAFLQYPGLAPLHLISELSSPLSSLLPLALRLPPCYAPVYPP